MTANTPETAPADDIDRLLRLANPVAVGDLPEPRSTAAEALYARIAERVESRNDGRAAHRRRASERRGGRRFAAAVAGSLLLVGGVAVAAVTQAPWWQDAAPPVNPSVVDRQLRDLEGLPTAADRSRARTVAEVDGAALVAVPLGKTGYCLIPSLPGSPDIGFSCLFQAGDEFRSYARPASQGAPRWIVYGRITDPRAAALDLHPAAGFPLTLALKPGGFFLANVPEDRWAALAGQAGEGKIVDASGATLRTGCVNWGPSPESPGAGLARYSFWRDGGGECRPEPVWTRPTVDLSRAQKLVELTLTADFSIWNRGTTIALWHAPATGGFRCVYVAAASPPPSGTSRGLPGGPGSCGKPAEQRPAPTERPFDSVSISSPGGLLTGHVDPASGIVRVELHSGSSSTVLPFERGYFLGQLSGDRHIVVGYDSAGNEVASVDLEKLRAQATPH